MEGQEVTQAAEETTLSLSKHLVDKHGRSQFRVGGNRNTTVRFGANFFNGAPPDTIMLTAANVASSATAAPKVKLTKEERAALPKPTPQEKLQQAKERAARAAARAARLEAALAAANSAQPAAEVNSAEQM